MPSRFEEVRDDVLSHPLHRACGLRLHKAADGESEGREEGVRRAWPTERAREVHRAQDGARQRGDQPAAKPIGQPRPGQPE